MGDLGFRESVEGVLAAVNAGDAKEASAKLRTLPRAIAELLPADWVEANAEALVTGRYDTLTQPFIDAKFVGPRGHFLIVAPYTMRQSTGDVTTLSLFAGEVLAHESLGGIPEAIEAIQCGPLRQKVTAIFPIRTLAVSTRMPTFAVPDCWPWRDSSMGPALSDVEEQGRWFWEAGRRTIERVFEPESARFLLAPLESETGITTVYYRSYEIHDAGHSSGLGLRSKTNHELMPRIWHRGVEEWRADGIGFELGYRLLSKVDAANDLASNLVVRFGLSRDTNDDLDGPTEHVPCTLIMLDRLLREQQIVIRSGRLALREPTLDGVIKALEPQRQEAIEFTKRELALGNLADAPGMCDTIHIHPTTKTIFDGMIRRPSREIYEQFSLRVAT
jgi:hypothetical protein